MWEDSCRMAGEVLPAWAGGNSTQQLTLSRLGSPHSISGWLGTIKNKSGKGGGVYGSGRTLLGYPPCTSKAIPAARRGGLTPPAAERTGPSSPASSPPPPPLRPRFVFKRYSYARGGCVRRAFEPNTPSSCRVLATFTRQCRSVEQHSVSERRASISSLITE